MIPPIWSEVSGLPPAEMAQRLLGLAGRQMAEAEPLQRPGGLLSGVTFHSRPQGSRQPGVCEAQELTLYLPSNRITAELRFKVLFVPKPPRDGAVEDPAAYEQALRDTDARCRGISTARDFFPAEGSAYNAGHAAQLLELAIAQDDRFGLDRLRLSREMITAVREARCPAGDRARGDSCYDVYVARKTGVDEVFHATVFIKGGARPSAVRVEDEGRAIW